LGSLAARIAAIARHVPCGFHANVIDPYQMKNRLGALTQFPLGVELKTPSLTLGVWPRSCGRDRGRFIGKRPNRRAGAARLKASVIVRFYLDGHSRGFIPRVTLPRAPRTRRQPGRPFFAGLCAATGHSDANRAEQGRVGTARTIAVPYGDGGSTPRRRPALEGILADRGTGAFAVFDASNTHHRPKAATGLTTRKCSSGALRRTCISVEPIGLDHWPQRAD
jgi:hypothetical protein